jgi:hypothetical protein
MAVVLAISATPFFAVAIYSGIGLRGPLLATVITWVIVLSFVPLMGDWFFSNAAGRVRPPVEDDE